MVDPNAIGAIVVFEVLVAEPVNANVQPVAALTLPLPG